jgi:hypothetical protein
MNAVVFMVGLLALAGPPEKTSDVQGHDLGTRVRVIGSLGFPLGERIRIRGEWYKPTGHVGSDGVRRIPKDDSLRLRVTGVNGRRLEQEVVFRSGLVERAPQSSRIEPRRPGEAWEAEGFEVGGFMGMPDWASREIWGEQPPASPYGFEFVMKFHYVTVFSGQESPISK